MNGDLDLPQQAAAIAFRRSGDTIEICLIGDKYAGNWGIPKGLVDPGASLEETALNEAWEEAGLRGRLIGEAVGTYRYAKWATTFVVTVYLMEVLDQEDDWQESGFRDRKWTSFGDADSLLVDHPVRPLLDRASSILATRLSSRKRGRV